MNKIIFFIICFLIFPITLFSQETNEMSKTDEVLCSTYVQFEDITVDLNADFIEYDSGDPVMINGKITNNTDILLKDAVVYGRLLKQGDAGSIIVDDFVMIEGLTLASKEVKDISFNYLLPLNYGAGTYQMIFFVSDKNYDLSGTRFSNDLYSASVNFTIKSGSPEYVRVDFENIKINNEVFDVSNYFNVFSNQESIQIDIPVLNISEETQDVKVTYTIYKNSFATSKNKVSSGEKRMTLGAEESSSMSIMIDEPTNPTYLIETVVEVLHDQDDSVFGDKTTSYLHFFVNDNVSAKISLDTLLIKDSKYLVCSQVVGQTGQSFTGFIETIFTNASGQQLFSEKKDVALRGLNNATVFEIAKKKISGDTRVTTNIYDQQGLLIDSVSKDYACEDIKGNCSDNFMISLKQVLIAGGILVLLIGIIILLKRKINIELV